MFYSKMPDMDSETLKRLQAEADQLLLTGRQPGNLREGLVDADAFELFRKNVLRDLKNFDPSWAETLENAELRPDESSIHIVMNLLIKIVRSHGK